MANRKAAVVLVATSNDITRLPPELVREGRLDEICFVNLPHQSLRQEGFAIHLPRRDRRNPAPVGSHGPPDELRAWTRGRKVPAHRSGSVSTLDPGGD
jgi:SpoVK/Ycf46/Vps4 family AAA+-type ATPase